MTQERARKQEPPAYIRAARFPNAPTSERAYFETQEAIYTAPECDLSSFRLRLSERWHVVVLGDSPPEELERRLRTILAAGEPTPLPAEILKLLQERRARATKKGPWAEGHY